MKTIKLILLFFLTVMTTQGEEFNIEEIVNIGSDISIHAHPKMDAKGGKYIVLFVEEEFQDMNAKKVEGVDINLLDKDESLAVAATLANRTSSQKNDEKFKFKSMFIVCVSEKLIEKSEIVLQVKDGGPEDYRSIRINMNFLWKNKIIHNKLFK